MQSPERKREYQAAYEQREETRKTRKAYRQSQAGKAAKKRYQTSIKGKAARRIAGRKYYASRKDTPQRIARSRVSQAVKTGRLQKQPCAWCGAHTVQAHHADYEKPLDVLWLCRPCHKNEHAKQAVSI
jgi:ribosomal protein S27AE